MKEFNGVKRKNEVEYGNSKISFLPNSQNVDSLLIPLQDGSFLEFGDSLSIDGDYAVNLRFLFRNKNTTEIDGKPVIVVGLPNIFRILDDKFNLYASGYDPTSKIIGVKSYNTYRFDYEVKVGGTVNYLFGDPKFAYQPTKLRFDLLDGKMKSFDKFRNVFAGPYSTIVLTIDKKLMGWGKNPNNMLNIENYDFEEFVFPPRFLNMTILGDVDDIKQIAVGEKHTLILKNDNSIWAIGSNEFGCLTINETSTTEFVRLKIPESYAKCIDSKKCSVDFVFSGVGTTFIGITDSQTVGKVEIQPYCFGKSHLEIKVCSGNGICNGNDKCSCFIGFHGQNCEFPFDCSALHNCSGNGFCVRNGKCECFSHATSVDCSVPVRTLIHFHFSFNFFERVSTFLQKKELFWQE